MSSLVLILQCPLNLTKVDLIGALLNWTQSFVCAVYMFLWVVGVHSWCGVSADLFSGVPHFQCSHQKEAASVAKTAAINMQRVALFKKKQQPSKHFEEGATVSPERTKFFKTHVNEGWVILRFKGLHGNQDEEAETLST